jgi:hypothetical protein
VRNRIYPLRRWLSPSAVHRITASLTKRGVEVDTIQHSDVAAADPPAAVNDPDAASSISR